MISFPYRDMLSFSTAPKASPSSKLLYTYKNDLKSFGRGLSLSTLPTAAPRWTRMCPRVGPTAQGSRAALARVPQPPSPTHPTRRELCALLEGDGSSSSIPGAAAVLTVLTSPEPSPCTCTDSAGTWGCRCLERRHV